MRKLAGALFLLAGCGAAWAEPVQLYGRLNLGVEGAGGGVRLSNYRSVFGLRASEDLGGVRLLFQVEGTVAPDSGAGAPAARDTRVGLQGRWGTLFAGNWSTPYTSATSTLDPFYPTTAGYMSIMGNGSASSADNASDPAPFDRRQRNSVHYWSPALQGLALRLAHGMNEETLADGARPALDSGALLYEQGGLYAALAWERHRAYHGIGSADDGLKLALARQLGHWRLAAVAERLRYRSPQGQLRRHAWYLSLSRQMGRHAVRAGLARANDGAGSRPDPVGALRAGPDTGAMHGTLGYELALSKRSSAFVFYSRLRNEPRAAYDFAINPTQGGSGAAPRVLAAGLRHAF